MTVTFFTTVQAQITTAIRGTVVDQQDKAVVDASVKITHTASGTVSLASSPHIQTHTDTHARTHARTHPYKYDYKSINK